MTAVTQKRDSVQKFLAAMPEQFRTPAGAARMLADMSEITSLRPVAERWFKKAGRSVQLDLIRNLDDDPARARMLLYLAPDAAPLLSRLTILQIRRICDDQSALIGSLQPSQLIKIIRLTDRRDIRADWMAMICEALSDNEAATEGFFDHLTTDDFVSWFHREFRVGDLKLLENAKDDPIVLVEVLEGSSRIFQLLYEHNYSFYRECIEAIATEVYARHQNQSEKRTQLLLQGMLGRNMKAELEELQGD